VVIATECIGSLNPTVIRSRPRQRLINNDTNTRYNTALFQYLENMDSNGLKEN
jgi:hypothetical protein